MTYTTHLKGAALAALCAVTLVACEGGTPAPTSPSAVVGTGGAASNPDGTIVKVTAPVGLSPNHDATGITVTPILVAQPGVGRFGTPTMSHRFQVSVNESFDPILHTGTGNLDAQGIQRFVMPAALAAGVKHYWRVRVEAEDQPGSWSPVRAFTTAGTVAEAPRPEIPGEKRTPNPAAGRLLGLPDMRGELARFNNASDSCTRGLKYVLNPWLIRVVDHFRTFDTRWGFNAKPSRGAADNAGVPVVAAGDEAAYNPTSLADEGNTNPLLVDLLVGHCGSAPTTGWRVFTGEEPGRWTGAGRF